MRYRYETPWRSTRMGGKTKYIAVCLTCRRVMPPRRERRTRSGTHGEDYWVHEHPLHFIYLSQSNSGNRSFSVAAELEAAIPQLRELVEISWIYEGVDENEVEELVRRLLKTLPPQKDAGEG